MNYLLTILSTPVDDNGFVVAFNRFMSPIVETDGIYVQYSNGVMLYHFDTKLDELGVRDHIRELIESFRVYVILTEINSNTTFGIDVDHADRLLNLGPDVYTEISPYVIHPKHEEPDMEYDEVSDADEVVQKLMQKYRVKEIEPTLDEVLEKIHAKGVSSLSIQEQAVLNQFK